MRIGMNHNLNSDNTHLKNKTHTKSSIIDETNFYLYAFKEDINTFIFLGNDNNTELMNHEITSRINFNLNENQRLAYASLFIKKRKPRTYAIQQDSSPNYYNKIRRNPWNVLEGLVTNMFDDPVGQDIKSKF